MKTEILFLSLILLLASGCVGNNDLPEENKVVNREENQPDLAAIRIKERPCETLEYVGKIGSDFDAALDSLRNLKHIPSEVDKVSVEVLFDYDNRDFYGIAYGDCAMYSDVLDTKGNYYLRSWYCPDENDIQEDTIFYDNKTFTIDTNRCATITYESRIGNNFNSALDSLKKIYKQTLDTYGEDGYHIEKGEINIDFSYDDRNFFLLAFIDKTNNYNLLTTSVVIDEKGNYFYADWHCPNENDIQEEVIFDENKRFTIYPTPGCATIAYESRIGNNFNSALDSLKKIYKQTLDTYGEDGYYVEKENINVDFSYDDRDFFLLTFIDKANIYNYLITSVVIDEKGNYFYANWCED
ncbi:MAG: hypothetical protein LBK47_05635 [Prevotellaceae bacterium]|jgi:hypothetical protein|nr:hypothetical protein [Prevotellaceae bacterium]